MTLITMVEISPINVRVTMGIVVNVAEKEDGRNCERKRERTSHVTLV